jgi:hypothetical protein
VSPELLAVVGASFVVALALTVAGLCYGLYRGEKGRRQAAETMIVLGVPERQPAGRVTMKNAPLLEPKMAPQGWDKRTLERGARELQEHAKAAGVQLPDDDALVMAEDMLRMGQIGGLEDDVAVG